MAIIDGRVYEIGIHTVNGYRIQVIDKNTYKTLGKADEPAQEPEPEPKVRFARINVNTCDAETLEELDGIGAAASRRIVKARPFETVDDLARVKGVTQKTVDANRAEITA